MRHIYSRSSFPRISKFLDYRYKVKSSTKVIHRFLLATLFFIFVYLPEGLAQPDFSKDENFKVYYSSGSFYIEFLSIVDNDQNDSWSSEAGDNPHYIKLNGSNIATLTYTAESADGYLLSSVLEAGVSFEGTGGSNVKALKLKLKVDPSLFRSGDNTVLLQGVWQERVSGGSDDYTDINETRTINYPAPNPPTGLTAEIDANAKVSLSWSAPVGDVDGFRIERNGTQVAEVGASITSWDDPSVNQAQDSYAVMSFLTYEGDKLISSKATAKPPSPPVPSQPSGLKASRGRCDGIIELTWDYNGSVSPSGFEIFKNGSSLTTVSGDMRNYEDNVGEHTTAVYEILAKGPISNSDKSSQATGDTYGYPSEPSGFIAYTGTSSISLSWSKSNSATKYLIKRTSTSGNADFEITDVNKTSFTDNSVNGCETYTYQLFAANGCTADEGTPGIEASSSRSVKIVKNLSSYIKSLDASKAYYPDKVVVEWSVKDDNLSLVDAFEIWRKKSDESSFKLVSTVTDQASYEDNTAAGGSLYEYRVVARLMCENSNLSSNSLTTVGFRIPYGVVNGNISYEDGVNVKGVEVMAEKGTEALGASLKLDGNDQVTVSDNAKLNPSEAISLEAWIKPSTVSRTGTIFKKSNGTQGYHLYQSDDDIVFELNIGGVLKSVRADQVLTPGEYTHVAGTYSQEGLKIFINGKVPSFSTFIISPEDTIYLSDIGYTSNLISQLSPMIDVEYPDKAAFVTQLELSLGQAQAEAMMPLLMPVIEMNRYLPGTYDTLVSGSISQYSSSLQIGYSFAGNIDELRIWDKSRTDEEVYYDYKRIVGNDEEGLAAYWRCDENFGNKIYDASKSKGEFHKNDGVFSGVNWSPEIPSRHQLGWMGKTDASGDYIIPYIPYLGSGENFTITPRYEQHQFKASSKTIFLGQGSGVLNAQDFTDISSFKVTGTVFYENTFCGVEGAILTIDGEPVIKNGNPVYTNDQGEFEISVPVGDHFISVEKSGHIFRSYKFPPGPESVLFNFQEPLNGINFIDETTVRVAGRVVGGTLEGNKKPGLGLSKNNIGVAEFKYTAATGCTSYQIKTDSITGEFIVDLPPMAYIVEDFRVAKNPAVQVYFTEFPKADFSQVSGTEKVSSHTYSGAVDAIITIDTLTLTATLDIDGVDSTITVNDVVILNEGRKARFIFDGDAYEYNIDPDTSVSVIHAQIEGNGSTDSLVYNYRYDLIYRTAPEVRIAGKDGVSDFRGDKSVQYEDPVSKTIMDFDVSKYPFQYPVFTQGKEYTITVFAEEVYYNNDICQGINGCPEAAEDRVPVNDGELVINNQLAMEENPEAIKLNEGRASYTFKGGQPQILTDANFPWRDYTGVFNLLVEVEGVSYPWEPVQHKDSLDFTYPLTDLHPDDRYFRGYVLGCNPVEGSDFITEGPQMVDMILRDPPGSESYSYVESGSTFSFEESFSMGSSVGNGMNVGISLGPTFELGTPLGGWAQEVDVVIDFDFGLSLTSSKSSEGSLQKEVTINESWQTSDSPELAGAPSDLFYGSSVNYVVSLADNLSIFPADFAQNNGIPTAGKEAGATGNTFRIGLNKSLMAAPDGSPTHFIYTADHIENYLIPNLMNVRNNLFITDPRYSSNIAISDPLYGSNNDDPRWEKQMSSEDPMTTVPSDWDGPSYTYKPADEKDKDMVRKYNEQIRLWEEALERNEMEKYYSELIKNISFDAGPTFEHSTSTEVTRSHTTSFELEIDMDFAMTLGGYVGGLGGEVSRTIEINRSVGHTTTTTSTLTNTFGYVLHDPDQGDYFSVDVRDPGTGTGPVFAIKGGRSMCPHETASPLNYFVPASYTVTDSALNELTALNLKDSFRELLSWSEKTGKYNLDEIKSHLPVSDAVMKAIPSGYKFEVPQLKERQFNKRHELESAIKALINLNFNLDEVSAGQALEALQNMANMSQEELEGMDGNMESGETEQGRRIYLFSTDDRATWTKEFIRFDDLIYEITAKPTGRVQQIDASTVRREVPSISITPSIRENVPEDNKAYFTLQLGNNSHTNEMMWYELALVEATNPDGAMIFIDDEDVKRTYELEPGARINKTLTVEIGKPEVYEYDSIAVVFYSPCDFEYSTNGRSMDAEAIDTVYFSVHFVPSCCDIEVALPTDDYVINSDDEHLVEGVKETKVPVLLTGYDLNNSMFDKLSFQFKSSANPDWIVEEYFHMIPEIDEEEISGKFTALEWDLSGFPDGEYNIRAKTYCGTTPDGTEIFDLSEVWTGIVDRKPPKVFGSPQPADGILSPDDVISIEFNESIFGEKLSKLENFDIRGILNGTEIRHDVSAGFNNDPDQFIRIPDGINLAGKSFTIEFWIKPERAYHNECILSQSTNSSDAIYIGTNDAGHFVFQVGNQQFEEKTLSLSDIQGKWVHMAFVYDNIRREAIVMKDGLPLSSGNLAADYGSHGDIYVGKSISGSANPFEGNIHELRIWERPRTASAVASNMLVTLSGKETGLSGYWPLDDAYGHIAAGKVHKRNATVNTYWDIYPSGYAASFESAAQGMIDMEFSNIAFTPEQDFTIEFWFRAEKGREVCFLSNGHGDYSDMIMYYISPEALANISRVLPLEDSVRIVLQPLLNRIFGDENAFMEEVALHFGQMKADLYREQILRFSKHMPTYWSINTDASGNIQVNNNGKRMKYGGPDLFDNSWHHFALVVERVGNTRMFIDGELSVSEPSTEWNGFGAARLFVGARGLFRQELAGFEFDQYFDGSMDEIRIWNTVLKQTQIQRNANLRLDGDELGLLAYLPFETYEDLMGVPVMNGITGDLLSGRETITNPGVVAQDSDVPNIRMVRPSSKVDFSFVAKQDQIAFVINEPVAKIENCILDITVKSVEDMYGNKMSSPITWSAYVDMNQVKWNDQEITLEKKIYDPLSFNATIRNGSGLQQNFSIENLPGWLTAEPRNGTLEPLTEKFIQFTVSEGVNIGSYSQDIHLQTDFDFDEKLRVNLRVYENLPADWKLDPSKFENSMNIIGRVVINDIISIDPFDKVAAFVGEECRGIANLKYVAEYDMYEVYMDVYSNEEWGEYFELHIWDASTGREYRRVSAEGLKEAPAQFKNKYEFIENSVYGSPSNPVYLKASSVLIQKIPLLKGWNWRSFNLTMDYTVPIIQQLNAVDFKTGDMIKGQASYAQFDNYWIGTLHNLYPEQMYMFYVDNADTLYVSGEAVMPSLTPLNILKGWNWIGYTPLVNISINEALGNFNPAHGDLIKSQYAFAMYDERMGWIGTLEYLKPNEGYKFKYSAVGDLPDQQTLIYPEQGTNLKTSVSPPETPVFTEAPRYRYNMPVIAVVNDARGNPVNGDCRLRAFNEQELRGSANGMVIGNSEKNHYFLLAYSNLEDERLRFTLEDDKGRVYMVNESLTTQFSSAEGSLDNPLVLTINEIPGEELDVKDGFTCTLYPNPFKESIRIQFNTIPESQIEISLVDGLGKVVYYKQYEPKGYRNYDLYPQGLQKGVYFIKIKTDDTHFIERVIKH